MSITTRRRLRGLQCEFSIRDDGATATAADVLPPGAASTFGGPRGWRVQKAVVMEPNPSLKTEMEPPNMS